MKAKVSKSKTEKKLVATTIKLPQEWAKHLKTLQAETGKSESFYMKEALKRYLEDIEDLQVGLKILKKKSKTYTSQEADKRLAELSAKYHKSTAKHV